MVKKAYHHTPDPLFNIHQIFLNKLSDVYLNVKK